MGRFQSFPALLAELEKLPQRKLDRLRWLDLIDAIRTPKELGIVIGALGKRSSWRAAVALLHCALCHGGRLQPDLIVYNRVMAACERDGAWPWASSLLDALTKRGLVPDEARAFRAAEPTGTRKPCGLYGSDLLSHVIICLCSLCMLVASCH